jgi:DNA-binding response OmpR family regulator
MELPSVTGLTEVLIYVKLGVESGFIILLMPLTRTILMVDDDPQHLQMQSWIMHQAGFRVVTVVVGRSTFSLPQNEQPGLILMDYRLNSDLTSAQVAGLLRQTFAGVPIVLLSNVPDMPEEMAPLVDRFMKKGEPEELVQFVRGFFNGGGQIARAATPTSI